MSKLSVRMAEKYASGEGVTQDVLRRVIIEVLDAALGEAKEQCRKMCGTDCDCADRVGGMEFE